MSCSCTYPIAVELRIQAMHFAVQIRPASVDQAKLIEEYLKGDAVLTENKQAFTASDRAELVTSLLAKMPRLPQDMQHVLATWVAAG